MNKGTGQYEGSFLGGNFYDKKLIYMKVPEGFEHHYPEEMLLLLQRTG